MMSIYIKGMEMPTNCSDCPLCYDMMECSASNIRFFKVKEQVFDFCTERHPNCPLIPVPPHGRLIDADALHKLFEDQWHYLQVLDWNENPTAEAMQSGINWCINTMHDDAPTIIPADKGGEE